MFVSALFLRGIADHLRSQGVKTDELLRWAGIEPAVLSDPSARVPLDSLDRYVSRAMAVTNDPGLGLTLAEGDPAGAHGVLYHLLLACSSLRAAISAYQRVAGRLVEHAQWELTEEGDTARFVYRSTMWLGDTSRFAADFALAFGRRLAAHFRTCNPGQPNSVSFRHARPVYAARYWEIFRCPIEFEAPQDEVVFTRDVLDLDRYLGNDLLKQTMESSAARLLFSPTVPERLSERVRVIIRYSNNRESWSGEAVARRLGLSERTLRRKLHGEGLALMDLIDEVRKEIACEELRRPEACIPRTADRLGFASRTSFHRAFKRWTGETPQTFRVRSTSSDV